MKKSIIALLVISPSVFASTLADVNERLDETWDKVNKVQDEARDMNADTNERINAVQTTLSEEGKLRAEGDRIVQSNAKKYSDALAKKEAEARANDVNALNNSIDNNTSYIAQNSLAIQNNSDKISTNRTDINKNSQAIQANSNRIDMLESWKGDVNKRFSDLDKKLSDGVAGVAAMANIPSPAVAGSTTIGAGVGNFNSSTAIAVGFSTYRENGVSFKASVSTTGSCDSTTVGAGVGYTF